MALHRQLKAPIYLTTITTGIWAARCTCSCAAPMLGDQGEAVLRRSPRGLIERLDRLFQGDVQEDVLSKGSHESFIR
ncbi:hypothetical protein ACVBEG_27130 [Pseudomonas sp. GG8]